MSNNDSVRYIQPPLVDQPHWKKFVVESNLPEKLNPLRELSRNLWWVWNQCARDLFQSIDNQLWEECEHNPILLLENVSFQRLKELEEDQVFIAEMHSVYGKLTTYLNNRKNLDKPQVAYFSMEYGLHDSLKIFSGGLGILAGDYLKEASDSKVNLVGVGLLYRYGYFKQTINMHGEQINNYVAEHFSKIPVQPTYDKDGNWIEIEVEFPGRNLKARVWEAHVGAVKLYLMETDHDVNNEQDRSVTHNLYGGDIENRLKQEMLLGIGGIRALKRLGYDCDIYHCNEGHAALIGVERMADLMSEKQLNFAEAKEVVRASTLFTTHTPVPAGHDSFHRDLFAGYMMPWAQKLGLDWEEFLMLGKSHPNEDHFNMSFLASHMSQGINGVSMLHGDVSKGILKGLYPGYMEEEIEVGYVTNGVHYSTWTAKEWKEIHMEAFGEDFLENQLDFDRWNKIYDIPDEKIWTLRQNLRMKTIEYIRQRFSNIWIQRHENPKLISEIMGKLNPNALTVGFARRFATYKRAHLLFRDLERLAQIVNNPSKPVQFIFAGKAHPADKMGQDLIKYIVEISKRPEFRGKILFVQNYDINLAKMLLQGVDVWLNTPTRPLEASGTSGEKGVMNGTLHFSVMDGWWVEGYKKDAGWALAKERTFDVQDLQDELDAATIYDIFEKQIIPAFYDRNTNGIPEKWVGYIKNNIAGVAPHFTTTRMIRDYQDRFYHPQHVRTQKIVGDNYKLAREMAAWKFKISSVWDQIEVKDISVAHGVTNVMKIGQDYPARITVDLKGMSSDEIGLELVVTSNGNAEKRKLVDVMEFKVESCVDGVAVYTLDIHLQNSGTYSYGLRMFPKNVNLPHRMDFSFTRWL
ncbi:alpha-glucan phosphorylases [Bacteroidales bacterium 6E]|nr:alpha-glucan phosphorylases [Bacteroidales bacterium 6E]